MDRCSSARETQTILIWDMSWCILSGMPTSQTTLRGRLFNLGVYGTYILSWSLTLFVALGMRKTAVLCLLALWATGMAVLAFQTIRQTKTTPPAIPFDADPGRAFAGRVANMLDAWLEWEANEALPEVLPLPSASPSEPETPPPTWHERILAD